MTTLKEVNLEIKKGMKFTDPNNLDMKYEVTSDLYQGPMGDKVDVIEEDSKCQSSYPTWWNSWEFTGIKAHFQLVDPESWGFHPDQAYWQREYKPKKICWHSNKKKVIVFNTSGYYYCPDCQQDLGDLTEKEFYQAVKEQF